ncbi:ubiquinone biosynthesis accessory factor UbiJ [Arsukibacterium indicum]|uniref:Ubiquinone biosynthesis accessory factor UbiJ n=1 Tax=Arsukibacterium indicum TaxID=2848612 RepID=A0ABS6MQ09_9GAMM|nr:SCP2 sterol-binding domain-containing protein [Arsukibacterium indicum]MBV2130918.1 SCP2 sterol-binding domain-containing protein [Arsukibacterium indicum]
MFTALLPQLLCASAERLCQSLISMDNGATERLKKLQGKQLAFTLREFKLRMVLTAGSDRLLFNQHNEAVDCAISTDLASLRQLRDASQLTRLIKADALQIEGDIQVAQQYSYFLQSLDPDWQEALSGYVGDGMAHKIALSIKQLQRYLQEKTRLIEQSVTMLAQDELLLTPGSLEMQQFSEDVSDLSARVARLTASLPGPKE